MKGGRETGPTPIIECIPVGDLDPVNGSEGDWVPAFAGTRWSVAR
jgi:hypothetical protein